MSNAELDRINLENFARRIAAKKLARDEPFGSKLTEEEWKQCLPEAQRWLEFRTTYESKGHGHVQIQGTCPADATVEEVRERFYHFHFGGRGAWVKDSQFGCIIHTD